MVIRWMYYRHVDPKADSSMTCIQAVSDDAVPGDRTRDIHYEAGKAVIVYLIGI
jgi:hypothetical protein